MTTADTPSLRIDPAERHGQIETDVFCTQCFYNLHGQLVTIDPNLNIPICRCPECGRFHPAGTGVTASKVWMRRFAAILLLVWVAIVGATALAISFGFFGLGAASVGAFAYSESIPVGSNKWRYEEHLHPWQNAGTYEPDVNGIATMMWISAGSLVLGFILGTLCVTWLWHWQKARYLWVMIVPLLPLIGLVMIFGQTPEDQNIRLQCFCRVLSQTGIQSLGILIGVLIGRKVSRQIVTLVIPPKPRQSLAFLWMVDGLKPPT